VGRPEDHRKPWESFLSRAASALGEARDAVVRGSQIGKIKLDAAFLRREREAALARFGAAIHARAEAGELALPPELEPLRQAIRDLDDQLAQQDVELEAVEAEVEMQREAARVAEQAARDAAADLAADKYEGFGPEGQETPAAPRRRGAGEEICRVTKKTLPPGRSCVREGTTSAARTAQRRTQVNMGQ